ncbi:NADP-dependent phosphogluconate dehydrogenase [Pleionea litopenaei]|uniref:6-phosphogluconate dehydrogenase, decarboxylating n=1 Tax=Pleionea litopenaei TaxID=3070815 RepID=A0AA51RW76_9GAMM|nr:NADP-dependent phosphogluconate dehydrogenase [Pleionea sp. HL-JVS1]WMS88639.1 NADP-dependent phosphogluconate dehydrogenase [Pleionea sp. HL-JVS1]
MKHRYPSSSASQQPAPTAQLNDIGFIGAGVMGQNLIMNLVDNGYTVTAFDLDQSKLDTLLLLDQEERGDQPPRISRCSSYTELLASIRSPHLIILSVPAGSAVDDVCHKLIDAGIAADDILVDTGNSLWTDTIEREKTYEGKLIFFGTAVSGGEVGARFGPSLMPSGDPYAWTRIKPIWEAIAAKVESSTGKSISRSKPGETINIGEACTTYIGPSGSGHYVKMVHNGIEYADMQLLCEAYQVLRFGLDYSCEEISSLFSQWNQGPLASYLLEVSAEVLKTQDPISHQPLVDVILDQAGQKGTGLWTSVSSLELGCPAPTIAEAVFARAMSTKKLERLRASDALSGPTKIPALDTEASFLESLHDALLCAKTVAYAQGFDLMRQQARQQNWNLDFAAIAKIWRGGCIIRAALLRSISAAFQRDPDLENLCLDVNIAESLSQQQQSWREAVARITLMGIPTPALSSALSYYDSYRSQLLPANLLQAQRDYFGAHSFERVDSPRGKKFHFLWGSPSATIVEQ